MLLVLEKSLVEAGLLGTVSTRGGLGKPDAITLKNDVEIAAPADIGLIAEFKSTHNLPMPMTDSEWLQSKGSFLSILQVILTGVAENESTIGTAMPEREAVGLAVRDVVQVAERQLGRPAAQAGLPCELIVKDCCQSKRVIATISMITS